MSDEKIQAKMMSDEEWYTERQRIVVQARTTCHEIPLSCSINCPIAQKEMQRNCAFEDEKGLRRFNKCPYPIMVVRRYIRDRNVGLTKTKW